jgi:hypothetical protein
VFALDLDCCLIYNLQAIEQMTEAQISLLLDHKVLPLSINRELLLATKKKQFLTELLFLLIHIPLLHLRKEYFE